MAILLALKSLDVGAGDEVVIPTFACRSLWDAVRAAGATPVFCDTGDDWCANEKTIGPRITRGTKAVIVVHTYGIAADIKPVCKLGVPVIEDCCHSFGGAIGNKPLGTFGKMAVLSFFATKLLATGEGGMIVSKDTNLLKKIREIKSADKEKLALRYRFPMTDFQAALGLSQLARYDRFLKRRREIAEYYFENLAGLPVRLPVEVKDRSIFFRFPLRISGDFETTRKLFDAEGVHVRHGGIDSLLHLRSGMRPGSFPISEKLYAETLSIPLYPALTDGERKRVVKACERVFSKPPA